MWFRRDLRVADHPALSAACARAGEDGIVALFVHDRALLRPCGEVRRAALRLALDGLAGSLGGLGGSLVERVGDPVEAVGRVAAEVDASHVYVSADFAPYGSARDRSVGAALRAVGAKLVAVGSPYAVDPGTLFTASGTPFKVFTPFAKAWMARSWPAPTGRPDRITGVGAVRSDRSLAWPDPAKAGMLAIDEESALDRLDAFVADDLKGYAEGRNVPAVDGSSRLSAALKWGTIHPRTILAELDGHLAGESAFRTEIAWREFYADVLFNRPDTARSPFQPAMAAMQLDTGSAAAARFDAWCTGHTGYPIIDAGMRQLLGAGWMHNRVRMLVASFLVKDLHLDWTLGARWFMRHLADGDLASNQHGWQWAAGTGTDASPYFRIFNPITQAKRFDPDAVYIKRWVSELAHLAAGDAHEPWRAARGGADIGGYPAPIVDHAHERDEALRRYKQLRA